VVQSFRVESRSSYRGPRLRLGSPWSLLFLESSGFSDVYAISVIDVSDDKRHLEGYLCVARDYSHRMLSQTSGCLFRKLSRQACRRKLQHESTQRARGALQDASARAASYKLQKFNVSYTISPLLTHDSWQRVSSQVAILNQNQSINVVKPFLLRYR
jgi:hypothetical protein